EKQYDAEERGFSEKAAVKKLAKIIMADPNKATDAYNTWKDKGYTLKQLSDFLKSKTKGKYDQVYNGYVIHVDYV
ncbi:hypothetical protein DVH05_001164, partial [Phytophthora capsici]